METRLMLDRMDRERKEAEEVMKRNQTLMNEAGKMAHVGEWEFDIDT